MAGEGMGGVPGFLPQLPTGQRAGDDAATMTELRASFVQEAELLLNDGTDPAAVGAAVTTALCGSWEHDGACRWPHNNEIDAVGPATVFRTLFIAPVTQELQVRERIDSALRASSDWRVVSCDERPVAANEQELAARLVAHDGGGSGQR